MRKTDLAGVAVVAASILLSTQESVAGQDTPAPRPTVAATSPAHAVHGTGALTPELERALAGVREATARFQRRDDALALGWTEQYPAGCAVSPDGGQGLHYLNPELVDAAVDPLEPELVMYEPRADGSMELVGVDYVIPFEAWSAAEPPTLLGQPLMRNEPLGVWAIHIWAWRANPSGMFAPWNPDVRCDLAGR